MKLTEQSCIVSDRMEMSSRTITAQGFLVAPAVFARAGNIQKYTARDLGIVADGLDPNTIISLYRPPDEVLSQGVVQQWNNVPITMGHPPGNLVHARNWRERAVGDATGIRADGSLLAGTITVRDAAAVAAVQSGKKYLSCGYKFRLDPTPGTAADGESYIGIVRDVLPNHVAIVDMPRGGPICKIADSAQGGKAMRILVIDGIRIETEDSVLADAVTKLITERDAALVKNKAKVKIGDQEFTLKDPAPLQLAIDGLQKEVTDLKAAQLTPEQIEKKIAGRVKLIGDALKLVPEFKADGKADVQIQREVITSVTAKDEGAKKVIAAALDGVTVDAATPELLTIAFRLLASAPKIEGVRTTAADSALAEALTRNSNNNAKQELTGREKYIAALEGRKTA